MQQEPLGHGPDNSAGSGLILKLVTPVLIGLSEGLSYSPHFCAHRTQEHGNLQPNMTNDKPLVLLCSGKDDF